ncbi:uncharacterized protein LOC120566277 isoform X2 [Perca fluviatilis]|uniref:uncharacterized protein LOC120566277 isoform X2 n=1 Tax=Perca fluviatilis TaxID=8168 RepID=UPI001963BAC3|nr:uncharacterized protein LOC120566277 isoform X2 [Perca fluviatilis]
MLHHRKQIFSFNMLEAQYPTLLLFVTTLLMVTCRSTERVAEQDVRNYLCVCSGGLIFFNVKADVELHPNSESISLLLDRENLKDNQFLPLEAACLLLSGLLYGSSFWTHPLH